MPLLAGVLAAVAVAGIGLVYVVFFQPGHSGHALAPPAAAPSLTPRATLPTTRPATPSPGRTSTSANPGVAQFPALAGLGCAPGQGTAAVMGIRSTGGDGWSRVTGGLPACGGRAVATRKTGTTGLVQDTFTWTFHTGHPATCAAQIFIANTNPSSGYAQYEVYGGSLATGASIGQFRIDQGGAKGQWVKEGSWQVQNVLNIQLTDAPAAPGDVYHVTASAARVQCS
jgi:hypothetical protein